MASRHQNLRAWVLDLWAWFLRAILTGRLREHVSATTAPAPVTPEPIAPSVPPPEPVLSAPAQQDTTRPVPVLPARIRPPRPRRPRPPLEDEEEGLQWRFQSVILDRLEEYFHCLDRLRRHDRQAYRVFSRLGFTIVPDRWVGPTDTFTGPRPTLGGFLFPKGALGPDHAERCRHYVTHDDWEKSVYPSFVYFKKIRRPFGVQAWRGDVYQLTQLLDDRVRTDSGWVERPLAAVAECHIGLREDGSMTLLRERKQQIVTVPGGRRGQMIEGTRTVWQTPRWIHERGTCPHCPDTGPEDPVKSICNQLMMALATHTGALNRIVVRAKCAGRVAAFGIDLPRAPRFFRDRDATALARDGRRKRIFHFVRRHARQLPAGAVADVREHYRGIRSFDWNGYGIHIVLPANTPVYGMDVQTYDQRTMPPHIGVTVPESEVVRQLETIVSA